MRKLWFFVPLLFIGGILALPRDKPVCTESYTKDTTITAPGVKPINAQIANSEIERELGLGSKLCIPTDTAMLFEFGDSGFYGIWMRGMRFSIDIVWLDGSKVVTHIEKNVSPSTYPKIYTPEKASSYVIEFHSGQADVLQLQLGTQLGW